MRNENFHLYFHSNPDGLPEVPLPARRLARAGVPGQLHCRSHICLLRGKAKEKWTATCYNVMFKGKSSSVNVYFISGISRIILNKEFPLST